MTRVAGERGFELASWEPRQTAAPGMLDVHWAGWGLAFHAWADVNGPQAIGGPRQVTPFRIYRVSNPWLLAALLVAPVVALKRGIFRRPRPDETLKLCAKCGYDLRATPTRCPECGTAVL